MKLAYENLDRLTSIEYGNVSTKDIIYASNGNITTQTGIGHFYYKRQQASIPICWK